MIAVRPIRLEKGEAERAASEIWDQFEEWLETTSGLIPAHNFLWAPHWGPKLKVINVKGESFRIPLTVYARPADGTTVVNGFITLTKPMKLAVNLPIGGVPAQIIRNDLKKGSRLRDLWEREFVSVIAHEITHAKDIVPEKTYDDPNEDRSQYINDPAEVRAFMQQIAREVAEIFPTPGIQRVHQNPTDQLEAAFGMSDTWQNFIVDYATSESRRKIITGVVNYLHDLELL